MTGIKYSILPIFLFPVLLSSDSLAQPPCKKVYIVIDGGGKNFWGKPHADKARKRDADSIAKWLEGKGFKGKKLSPTAHPRDEELERLIKSYGEELECPPGSQCCHELFIYIIAHGKADYFRLLDADGNGEGGVKVTYATLTSWLEKLPPCVKLTIFIEACYSGGAIDWLKPLCERFGKCGVTIMTTTDGENRAPAGIDIDEEITTPAGVKVKKGSPSATQNFMEGADKDTDGDEDKGDIRDRWLEMEKKGEKYGPQLFMCKGQKRMCSLENVKDTVEKPGTLPLPPTGVLPGGKPRTPEEPKEKKEEQEEEEWVQEPEREGGAPIAPGPETAVAVITVKEGEEVQVAREIGGQAVATVLVNDEPRELPEPEEGITVSPGDVVQLISTIGTFLGQFTFVPEDKTPPGTPPVAECPAGKPAVVSVPGNYTGTAIKDIAVAIGPKEAPVVTEPVPVTAVGGLEPILKTDDTVVAAGPLDNSAMGSNAINVIDKNTGKVLGQAQIDMWRLAGASLNPPVVNKGQDTNLRLDVFGPPDLPMKVTATAGEGLTPKQLTATAPIRVLQKEGLGAFTATKSGTHTVSVKALPIIYEGKEPVMGLPAWR